MPTPLVNSLFTITVNLAAQTLTPSNFSELTLFVDEAEGAGNPLDGSSRYLTFTTLAAATAASPAQISTLTLAAITVAFNTTLPRPITSVRVVRVDTVAAETLITAYNGAGLTPASYLELNPSNVKLLATTTRAVALTAAWAAAVNTQGEHFLVVQSSAADIITTGAPATFVAALQWAGIYHSADTEFADMALIANRGAFDTDVRSVGWDCDLKGVAEYATDLTTAQVDFAFANNWNVLGTMETTDTFLSKGWNSTGRGIHELITKMWLDDRLSEALQALKLTKSNRGEKILVNNAGLAMVAATVAKVLSNGTKAEHFAATATQEAYTVSPQAVTTADVTAQQLRVNATAILGGNAVSFTLIADLTQT